MKNIINNGFIKPYAEHIKIMSDGYPKYFYAILDSFQIPVNRNEDDETVINWNLIKDKNTIFYNYEECESDITKRLFNSPIAKDNEVVIEFGFDEPVIKVKTKIFIENWYDFLGASGYIGITIVGSTGEYFIEFTNKEHFLLSNFHL